MPLATLSASSLRCRRIGCSLRCGRLFKLQVVNQVILHDWVNNQTVQQHQQLIQVILLQVVQNVVHNNQMRQSLNQVLLILSGVGWHLVNTERVCHNIVVQRQQVSRQLLGDG